MSWLKTLTDIFKKKNKGGRPKKVVNSAIAKEFQERRSKIPPSFIKDSWKLNDEQKKEICKLIGMGMTSREVDAEFRRLYNIEVTAMNYSYYSTISPKWRELTKKYRDEYLAHQDDIPGFHKKFRMKRMEKAFEMAEEDRDIRAMVAATEHQRKEIEGSGDTNLTLISNRYYTMSDKELEEKEQEILSQLQKGAKNGIRGIEVEAGKSGFGDRPEDVQHEVGDKGE